MPEAKINIDPANMQAVYFGEGNFPIMPACVALAKKAQKPVREEFTTRGVHSP